MSTTLKVLLVIFASLFTLCVVAGVAAFILLRPAGAAIDQMINGAMRTAPAEVSVIGAQIASYDIPAGFEQPFAVQAVGYSLVAYNGSDGHSQVFFFQLPTGLTIDANEIEKQARQVYLDGRRNENGEVQVVDRKPGVIAGQLVTLIYTTGKNHDGDPFREVTAVFQGKGGQAFVVYSRTASAWDDVEVDAFLASIH